MPLARQSLQESRSRQKKQGGDEKSRSRKLERLRRRRRRPRQDPGLVGGGAGMIRTSARRHLGLVLSGGALPVQWCASRGRRRAAITRRTCCRSCGPGREAVLEVPGLGHGRHIDEDGNPPACWPHWQDAIALQLVDAWPTGDDECGDDRPAAAWQPCLPVIDMVAHCRQQRQGPARSPGIVLEACRGRRHRSGGDLLSRCRRCGAPVLLPRFLSLRGSLSVMIRWMA